MNYKSFRHHKSRCRLYRFHKGFRGDFRSGEKMSEKGKVAIAESIKPEIMTLSEVSSHLRIHRTSVMRYVVEGRLKCHSLGNRRLFRRNDVELFFENQVAPESVFEKEV